MAPTLRRYTFDLDQDGRIVAPDTAEARRVVVVARGEQQHVCDESCACLFTPEDAGAAIDQRIRTYTLEKNEQDYEAAFEAVWPTLPQPLRDAYTGDLFPKSLDWLWTWNPQEAAATRAEAGDELHRRIQQRVKRTGEDYAVAYHAELAADPDLRARYAGGR